MNRCVMCSRLVANIARFVIDYGCNSSCILFVISIYLYPVCDNFYRTRLPLPGTLMLELVDHRDVIRDLKFAPDESIRLLSASRDGTLKLWELEDDGNMSKTLKGNSGWVYTCAWSPDAKIVCSAGERKSVSSIFHCYSIFLTYPPRLRSVLA